MTQHKRIEKLEKEIAPGPIKLNTSTPDTTMEEARRLMHENYRAWRAMPRQAATEKNMTKEEASKLYHENFGPIQ